MLHSRFNPFDEIQNIKISRYYLLFYHDKYPRMIKMSLYFIGDLAYLGLTASRALTHWGRVTHLCVDNLTIIGSDNGLSPGRRQAIMWTNDGILLIRTLETNSNEILIEIHTFSFKKIHLKMSSAKWRSFCLDLNVSSNLIVYNTHVHASPFAVPGFFRHYSILPIFNRVTSLPLTQLHASPCV